MIKLLAKTSVYQLADSGAINSLSTQVKSLINIEKGAIYVKEEQLEDVFYKIRHKSFNFSAKFEVIELFKQGIIKLIYNPHVKLTVAIPFFGVKLAAGGFGVVVNVTNYGSLNADGSIKIDPLTLYTLMLSGAYSLLIDANIGTSINYSLPELYGSLFVNTMARIANLDQIKKSKIQYIATKFFYTQLGTNDLQSSEKAASHIKNLDKYIIDQIDMQFTPDAYASLQTLVAAIKIGFPEFSGFELGVLFDRWMRTYGECSAFAIEYIPFFYMVFVALVTNSNNMINIKAIEKEANRHDKNVNMLFNKIQTSVIELSQR